jgi:hypothetical protein
MSNMMSTMYEGQILDKESVSVHSAFICMLHLANEKGLQFEQQGWDDPECDFRIQLNC